MADQDRIRLLNCLGVELRATVSKSKETGI